MFLATSCVPKELLHLSYIHHVRAEEIERGRKDVEALLASLPVGFRLLTDLGRLDYMDTDCGLEIGKLMDLCKHKVGMVVRVVPDPRKDIGLNILGLLHYGQTVHPRPCRTMDEAAKLLSL
jgi:hypothetical protein